MITLLKVEIRNNILHERDDEIVITHDDQAVTFRMLRHGLQILIHGPDGGHILRAGDTIEYTIERGKQTIRHGSSIEIVDPLADLASVPDVARVRLGPDGLENAPPRAPAPQPPAPKRGTPRKNSKQGRRERGGIV